MRFHGCLHPAIVRDLDQVVRLVIHAPARVAGLTVKLWELDDEEGGNDDLLAEFEGEIATDSRDRKSAGWRRFTSARKKVSDSDPLTPLLKLRLPGDETIHEIPIVSEADEIEGRWFELGLTMHHGGAEVFRSRAPCLVAVPSMGRFFAIDWDGLDEEEPEPLRWRHVYIGVPNGTGENATLKVLHEAYLDEEGRLLAAPPEEGVAAQPLRLRKGRTLYAWITRRPVGAKGETGILLSTCERIEGDHVIRLEERWDARPFVGLMGDE